MDLQKKVLVCDQNQSGPSQFCLDPVRTTAGLIKMPQRQQLMGPARLLQITDGFWF